jgi:hypothetical protein
VSSELTDASASPSANKVVKYDGNGRITAPVFVNSISLRNGPGRTSQLLYTSEADNILYLPHSLTPKTLAVVSASTGRIFPADIENATIERTPNTLALRDSSGILSANSYKLGGTNSLKGASGASGIAWTLPSLSGNIALTSQSNGEITPADIDGVDVAATPDTIALRNENGDLTVNELIGSTAQIGTTTFNVTGTEGYEKICNVGNFVSYFSDGSEWYSVNDALTIRTDSFFAHEMVVNAPSEFTSDIQLRGNVNINGGVTKTVTFSGVGFNFNTASKNSLISQLTSSTPTSGNLVKYDTGGVIPSAGESYSNGAGFTYGGTSAATHRTALGFRTEIVTIPSGSNSVTISATGVTATTPVIGTLITDDATIKYIRIVPTSGSYSVFGNGNAATAGGCKVSVMYIV